MPHTESFVTTAKTSLENNSHLYRSGKPKTTFGHVQVIHLIITVIAIQRFNALNLGVFHQSNYKDISIFHITKLLVRRPLKLHGS